MYQPKHILTTLFLSILAIEANGQQPKDVTAENIASTFFSESCGTVDYQALSYGMGRADDGIKVMQDSLEISFFELGAFIDRQGINTADCYMEIKVNVPANKRFRAVSATSEGTYSIGKQSAGRISIDYTLEETKAKGICRKEGLQDADDFQLTVKMDNQSFTQCYDYPTTVTLTTVLTASVWSKGNDLAEIVYDQNESNGNIKWDWNWAMCNDESSYTGLAGSWRTSNQRSKLNLQLQSGNCNLGQDERYSYQTAYGLGTKRQGIMVRDCSKNGFTITSSQGKVNYGYLQDNALVWKKIPLKIGITDVKWYK